MAKFKFSFAAQYNSERLFDIDTAGLEYHELQDIYTTDNDVYLVEGIYINTKGNYEDRPCVVARDTKGWRGYVNLPAHLTDQCRRILKDRNAVAAINAGAVGFTIYQYTAKNYNDKLCYSIRWVDIE